MDCPICTKKNTFSVTDNGFERMYNCFYANCDAKGSTQKRLTKDNSRIAFKSTDVKTRVVAKPTEFHLPTTFVPLSRNQKAVEYVRSVNSYQAYLDNYVDIMYDVRFDRAVFLIKDKGRVVDAVGKSLSNQKPKWYRYGKSNRPFICGRGNVVLLVEDCPSACSVFLFCKGIALLGTNLLDPHIDILKKYKKVVVALDKDATSKSCEIARKLSQYVDTSVAFLQDDLKNLKDRERERIIRKYID